jgi:hypothetical protein
MKTILWTLFVALVGPLSSTLYAQKPGAANPGQGRPAVPPVRGGVGIDGRMNVPPGVLYPQPAVPGLPAQEKRRDDGNSWLHAHLIPHVSQPHNDPTAGRAADLHTPRVVPPEVTVPASEFRFVPASEYRFIPPKFTGVMSEGGPAIARGMAHGKGGGIFAGIGAALAALFGSIFGRKKDC